VLAAEHPSLRPVVATQLIALRSAFLVRPGPGYDYDVGHVGVGIPDGGPGVFEGGDDPAAMLGNGPGVSHAACLSFSVCMPTGGQGGGWGPRAGWGRLLPGRDFWPRSAEAPHARVGPQDA